MRGPTLALGVLLILGTSTVFAAPGDRFEIHGTVLWPAQLVNEPFLVLRGDDGRVYSMDVAAARRATPMTVRAGDRLGVIAIEGAAPYALTAAVLAVESAVQPGANDTTQPAASPPGVNDGPLRPPIPPQALPPQAPPSEPAPPRASPPTASRAPEVLRLDGTIADLAAGRMQLRTSDGRQVRIDLNRVRGAVSESLRAGEQVTVFAERGDEDAFVAVGLVYPSGAR